MPLDGDLVSPSRSKLTKRVVDALEPRPGKNYIVFDDCRAAHCSFAIIGGGQPVAGRNLPFARKRAGNPGLAAVVRSDQG